MDKMIIQVVTNKKLVKLLDNTAKSLGLSRSSICNMYIYEGLSETLQTNIKTILEKMSNEVGG